MLLELERVRKEWPGGTVAVAELSLQIKEGEFIVLLGPSGCGKTTTLRMIAGLEAPTAGRIRIRQNDVTGMPPQHRDIGFVFQFYALYPHMTVAENIQFPLANAGMASSSIQAAVAGISQKMGITHLLQRKPRTLSGGDQQRVGLARAMVRKPAVWLMDEPLGTLDAENRALMCEFIRTRQLEQRVTTIYVTHDQDEAMRLADRIVVMQGGAVLQAASPRDLYEKPAHVFIANFIGSPGMNIVQARVDNSTIYSLSGAELAKAQGSIHGQVQAGIRPEDITLSREGSVPATVVTTAFTGTHRNIYMDTEAGRIIAIAGAQFQAEPGDRVFMTWNPGKIHYFDPETGHRIQ